MNRVQPAFDAYVMGSPSEYCHDVWCKKTRIVWLRGSEKIEDMFIRFDTIHERDRQTDRHRMTAKAPLACHRAAIKHDFPSSYWQ